MPNLPNRRPRVALPGFTPAAQQEASQTQALGSPPAPEGAKNNARSVDEWIMRYHNVWSGLTLSSFYQNLSENSLTATQYARWLLDRTSTSIALVEAATRAADILNTVMPDVQLPLLAVATEDAHFLTEFAVLAGLDINSRFRLSHPAARLVHLIEASTAPDAPPVVAITAVWTYMFASWQAWELCRTRGQPIPGQFQRIAQQIARTDAISRIGETERILDQLFNSCSAADQYEKAGKTFEEISRRSCAVLEHTLYMAEDNHIPLCICGRKGHFPDQCTFKSHI